MNYKELVGSDFRGCCVIEENNKIIFSSASGFSDLANEIPNTLETKFATASAGKVFVAVAILQLIEKGDLHLQDTLGSILAINLNYIDPEVTVEQLLTHTSGVPDYFDESIMDEYSELWVNYPNYKIRTNADLLPLFIDKPMMYSKGEKFQYNNTGFVLLAMIVEEKTGLPFDQYLKEKIFDVCNMVSTGYYELDRLPAKCAYHYIYDEGHGGYKTNFFSVDAKGTGAGDSFSPYFQGCDPGVSFLSAHDLKKDITVTLVSNYCDNVWNIMRKIREKLFAK